MLLERNFYALCKRKDGNRVDSFAVAVVKFKFRM